MLPLIVVVVARTVALDCAVGLEGTAVPSCAIFPGVRSVGRSAVRFGVTAESTTSAIFAFFFFCFLAINFFLFFGASALLLNVRSYL